MKLLYYLLFFLVISFFFPLKVDAANPKVPILLYHFIGNNPNPKDLARNDLSVSPDKFEAQMEYLSRNGYTPISLDTLYGIFNNQTTSPNKPVVLTFDDGYIDFYYNAFPILRRFNFNAVVFIPTGLIGKSYYMNWDQIKEIKSSGLVTFEGHSVNHTNLNALSYQQALRELIESKKILEGQTGYPVNFVAYPYGASSKNVQAAAKAAGYVGGVGTWYGKASNQGINMPRIKISGYMSLLDFASRVQ